MAPDQTEFFKSKYAPQDVRGGTVGVGLRWVLAYSLATIVVSFILVLGINAIG